MKLINSLIGASVLAFCGTALGQTFTYSEDFSGGDVPSGWTRESFGSTTALTNPSSFLNLTVTPNDLSTNWVNGIHYSGAGLNNLNFTDTNLANYTLDVELRSPDFANGLVKLELRSRVATTGNNESGRLRKNVTITDGFLSYGGSLDDGWSNVGFAGTFNITDPRLILRIDIGGGDGLGWPDGDGSTSYEIELNSFEFAVIPEPGTLALVALTGIAALVTLRRKRA